jgi:predicted RNase H-like HicB family nuclease
VEDAMAKKPTKYIVTDGEMVLELQVAEDGGYTVTSPFMKGLVTEATTLEEAFEMARDAVAGLEEARARLKQAATNTKTRSNQNKAQTRRSVVPRRSD